LGPILFCLAIHPILKKANRDGALKINLWFMDDGCLMGSKQDVIKAWNYLSSRFKKIGLVLNTRKSEWIAFDNSPSPIKDVPLVRADEFCLLGVPLGSNAFCLKFF